MAVATLPEATPSPAPPDRTVQGARQASPADTVRILAGDIGGTTARLVLYEAAVDPRALRSTEKLDAHRVVSQMYYRKKDFQTFTDLMLAFITIPANRERSIFAACLATAGPISDARINFTNREGWIIDARAIEEQFSIKHVVLVNDFVANGYGLLGLNKSDVVTLQPGSTGDSCMHQPNTSSRSDTSRGPDRRGSSGVRLDQTQAGRQNANSKRNSKQTTDKEDVLKDERKDEDDSDSGSISDDKINNQAPMALIGAGTGLGECFLTPDGAGVYNVHPSEGGHVEFVPRTDLEEELLKFIQARLDVPHPVDDLHLQPRVSVERILSGKGLENVYEFLREKFPENVNVHLDNAYKESTERARLISNENENYGLFQRTLEVMFAIYGAEVGNVALKYLPYGGMYVAGNIARANIDIISTTRSGFMRRYGDKGRMSSIMAKFPVYVVLRDDLGVRGAHILAARLAARAFDFEVGAVGKLDMIRGAAKVPADAYSQAEKDMQKLRIRNADSLRNAISDYPMTYAVATSITAAVTATAVVMGRTLLAPYFTRENRPS